MQRRMRMQAAAAALVLGLLVIGVFWPATRHGFVHWDDEAYVFENPVVRQGLTGQGLLWAFTTTTNANWHPVTWISHMIDAQLFGMHAGSHHLSSLILHLAATELLFLFLLLGTAQCWRSAVVAALFAVHPLHVESVAWVAERKDVLSGAFFMLVLLAYLAFAKRPSRGRYGLVVLACALGLMAKPMLVTLPAILILVDYWPLGRIPAAGARGAAARLLKEKVPLLLMSAAVSLVTFVVQVRGGTVSSLEVLPLGRRLASAAIAFVTYLGKTAVPTDLIFMYPYPTQPPPAALWIGAALLLAVMTFLAAKAHERHPVVFVGWFWYLVTLLPVIGIVQIGQQARADRYTYLPLVGVFLLVAWPIPAAARARRGVAAAGTLVLIAALALVARAQVGHWRDDLSLFGHAAAVDPGNWVARNNLGNALAVQGRLAEAVQNFTAAVRANPKYQKGWYNLGLASLRESRLGDAEKQLRTALALKGDDAAAHDSLGAVLMRQGRTREALDEFEEARHLDPRNPVTLNNLGTAWFTLGDLARAERCYRESLDLKPDYASPRTGLDAIGRLRGTKP
jgi:tetratricopeptide (TPR) repeat protein